MRLKGQFAKTVPVWETEEFGQWDTSKVCPLRPTDFCLYKSELMPFSQYFDQYLDARVLKRGRILLALGCKFFP